MDCYSSILTKESDGRERAQAQIAELINDYRDKSMFMLEADGYIPRKFNRKQWILKQSVYTFTTRRSFLMPVILYANPKHGAYLLLDMALKLPDKIEIKGRNIKVSKI